MNRLPRILIALAAVLALPAAAAPAHAASPQQIYDDCDNGRLDRRYSEADYRRALKEIPEDIDEYTNCADLIRSGLAGIDTAGGGGDGSGSGGGGGSGGGAAGGGGPSGLPQGNGVGSVPLDPKGKPLNPLIDAQDAERQEITAAQSGRDIQPTSAGVRPGEPDGELPAPMIVVLVLAGLAAVAAGALGVKQRFSSPGTA